MAWLEGEPVGTSRRRFWARVETVIDGDLSAAAVACVCVPDACLLCRVVFARREPRL